MKLSVELYPYDPARDEPWVTATWKRSLASKWRARWAELDKLVPDEIARYPVAVAYHEGLLVGFACFGDAEVRYMYVRGAFRQCGIAGALLGLYGGPRVYVHPASNELWESLVEAHGWRHDDVAWEAVRNGGR